VGRNDFFCEQASLTEVDGCERSDVEAAVDTNMRKCTGLHIEVGAADFDEVLKKLLELGHALSRGGSA
jgi:hypothetical protein